MTDDRLEEIVEWMSNFAANGYSFEEGCDFYMRVAKRLVKLCAYLNDEIESLKRKS